MEAQDADACERVNSWIRFMRFTLALKEIKIKFYFVRSKYRKRMSAERNANIIALAVRDWFALKGEHRKKRQITDYIIVKSIFEKRVSLDREAKFAMVNFLQSCRPRFDIK